MPLRRFLRWVNRIFGRKKSFRLAIYGIPNAGKTSLANRISLEWTGKELGKVSDLPHETRRIKQIKEVKIKVKGKEITIDLIDVPGISHKRDLMGKHFQSFLKHMSNEEANLRVREAIDGVKMAVKLLDHIDVALLVFDSTEDPLDPVNSLILGALESKSIPAILVANKADLPDADARTIREVYSEYPVVELSALQDRNFDKLYEAIAEHHK
ncbi:MAG: Era-like GTP-binding protein [Candidatus Altiarchaeota archaeon]